MGKLCVGPNVKSSQQFKDLQAKYDLHESELDNIMHEWINIEGNEETFPSDAFIQERINGTPLVNASQDQIELWQRDYSTPQTFDTVEEANRFKLEASRYFGDESIKVLKSNNDKYRVIVVEPTNTEEGVSFQEHMPLGGRVDVRLQSLMSKDTIDVQDLLDIVKDSEYSSIIELLSTKQNIFDGINVSVEDILYVTKDPKYDGRRAYYDSKTHTIHIKGNTSYTNSDAASVILHEVMHALTIERLNANKEAREEFRKIIDKYVASTPYMDGIQFSNTKEKNNFLLENYLEEFVADIWSNPEVINNLKKIKIENTDLTLWDKIKTFFQGLFSGIFEGTSNDSLMAKASIELNKLLDSTNKIEDSRLFRENIDSTRKTLIITGNASTTKSEAQRLNGVDTLRHPDANGMHFGNPFSFANYAGVQKIVTNAREAVKAFEQWLRGEKYQDIEPDRRAWIVKQINSGLLDGKELVYYTDHISDAEGYHVYDYDTFPNHAHILLKLINEHIARKNEVLQGKELEPVKSTKPKLEDLNPEQKAFMEAQTTYLNQTRMLEESGLTAVEISDIAESVGYALSDYLTWAIEGKMEDGRLNDEWVFDVFPTLQRSQEELDKIKGMTRRQFLDYVGIGNFFSAVQDHFEDMENYNFDMLDKMDVISQCWDIIMRQASLVFNDHEEFSLVLVSKDRELKDNNIMENPNLDNFNEPNTEADVEDNGGNSLEHWQTQDSTTDKVAKMSKVIKREISNCFEKDANGEIVYNSWGHPKRVQLRPSVTQIYNFTSGCLDINDMIQKLESHLQEAPWLDQLLVKLQDTSGKGAMFQSQFYTTFKVATNHYTKSMPYKGTTRSMPVNTHPALNNVMKGLKALFESGDHQLFRQNGIDKSSFEALKKNYNTFKSNLGQEGNIEERNNAVRSIVQMLLGESEAAVALSDFDNNNITLDQSELSSISNAIDKIITTLEAEKNSSHYNPLSTDKTSGIYGRLQEVFRPFIKKMESETSSMAYSNGKTFQTYVTPSWLSMFIDAVNSENGQAFLEQKYGASEFFRTDGVWRNWILQQYMSATPEMRKKMFQHHIEVEYNKKSYMRDMSSLEYALSLASNYFANQKEGMANYPLPMLGNKPSNEFISFPKISGNFALNLSKAFYENSTIGPNDVAVFAGRKSDAPEMQGRELNILYMEDPNSASGTNAEGWIDNILIKAANDFPNKTFKIMLDGFNDPNSNLMNHQQMLKILFSRKLPSNIKISLLDLENVASNAQMEIITALMDNFNQELSRIQTVMMRKQAGIVEGSQEYIQNFDKNGDKFHYLKVFNDYLKGGRLQNKPFGIALRNMLEGKDTGESSQIYDNARAIILREMCERADNILAGWETNGILQAMQKLDGVDSKDSNIAKQQALEMIWNTKLVETNLIQLLAIDKPFFKNEEDLQKRMPQVHSPGARVNKWASSINGQNDKFSVNGKVSADGMARTAVFNDVEGIKSNMLANIKEVFERKKESLKRKGFDETSPEYIAAEKGYNAIIKQFDEEIVLTDAQAYRCPTSLRKVAHMLGKWDSSKEALYEKIESGEYDYKDIQALSQIIKPFVFTHMNEQIGVTLENKDGSVVHSPIQTMPVPMQNKNSEYLIMLADAILRNETTTKPNLLRVFYRIMEESAYDGRTYDVDGHIIEQGRYNGKGIDVIQFKSAVKCGTEGVMDIQKYLDMDAQEGELQAYADIEAMIYQRDEIGEIIQNPDAYNLHSVRAFDFDNWCEQQEVDDHFNDHEQIDGSQKRAIIESDLESFYDDGTPVTYDFKDRVDGEWVTKKLTAKEFKQEYEETYARKIEFGIQRIADEFKISYDGKNPASRAERNMAVSKLLQKEVMNNLSRYGLDMLQAISLDENYEFVLPLADPTMYKRIEQLLNSMIKNRLNKQMMEGGPIVQVSNFGTTNELHTVFKDKRGGVLPTLDQWLRDHEGKTEGDYMNEVLEHQGGMAYMEVYASVYDDMLLDFMDKDGIIDVKAIEKVNPDLLQMIGYRIPTEDKYSILPLKIAGFLPRESGAAIMFPADITLITGSDFDVDKMYVQRKHTKAGIDGQRFTSDATRMLKEKFPELKYAERQQNIDDFLSNPEFMKNTDEYQAALYELFTKNNYSQIKISNSNEEHYLDNKIIDMTWAVLTNESTLDKMLNPGGFEREKHIGYAIAALQAGKASWEELMQMDSKNIKKLIEGNNNLDLTWLDTQIQFYEQNNAASTALGMSAVQKSAHALLESDGILIDLEEILKGQKKNRAVMSLCGTTLEGRMEIDGRADTNGTLIGRTLGEFVAMFADAVKDPVANLMNINNQTMPIITTLIRLGVPFEDAALFVAQPVLKEIISDMNISAISGEFKTLNQCLKDKIKQVDKSDLYNSNQAMSEDITREELIAGLQGNREAKTILKVLHLFSDMLKVSNEVKSLTTATRVNSIAAAAGPLMIDNYIFQKKLDNFTEYLYDESGNRISLNTLYDKHPMLRQFAEAFYDKAIVDKVFDYSPVNKVFLDTCYGHLPIGAAKIFENRKNLNDFVDFAYSYMAVNAGVVNVGKNELSRYINNFPSYFINQNFKGQYADNPFVQAIHRDFQILEDGTKLAVLNISYTSLDEFQKQKLRDGWLELSKVNPELSKQLFNYWFLRGGMTFNPRSGMALLPQQLRSQYYRYIAENGQQKVLYSDAFEEVNYVELLKQFFQNNANSYSLVPNKELNDGEYRIVNKNGESRLEVWGASKENLAELPAFKMKSNKNVLYFCIGEEKRGNDWYSIYVQLPALGSNDKYLEISKESIDKAMKPTAIDESTKVRQESDVTQNPDTVIDEEHQDSPASDNLDNPSISQVVQETTSNLAEQENLTDNPATREEMVAEAGKQLDLFLDTTEEEVQKQEEKLNLCNKTKK